MRASPRPVFSLRDDVCTFRLFFSLSKLAKRAARGAWRAPHLDASCIRPSRARREWLFLRPVTDRSLTASACSHGAAVLAISTVIGMHCGGES